MENHHSLSSPTNNAINSSEDSISANHINELPITAVFSNNNSNGDQVKSAEEIEAYISSFPAGFRFCPTDEELVTHYLKRKLDNLPLPPNMIYEINIYKHNPEIIAAHVKPTTKEKVWYILTPRDRKYPNGKRPSRSAGDGYWKATGADKPIKDHKKTLIGLKKALVFYIGKAAQKGEKTDWIMHEYRVPEIPNLPERDAHDWTLDEWVLCKIYKKSDRVNTVFTQRKKSMDYEYIDEVLDTSDDGQVHESSNENLSSHAGTSSEAACKEYSTRHGSTDFIDMLRNPNNHATTFHTRLSNFAQTSHMATFCNMPWSTTSAYDYQSCVPQFNGGVLHDGTSMTNDRFYQCAPSPMMIEPISYARATTSSIGQDHTMKSEGFGIPCFNSCIGDGYTEQECYGEYVGHEKLSNNGDQCDAMDCIDQYLVNCEMNNSTIYLPEHNTKNFVDGESSKSKWDC